jgi:ATP-dependent Clp protease ATP-binding subunit ClpB
VILFDEIEKAHTEIFNVLLQILDDGRLTDGKGRTVDFRNSVIIMTSNLGNQLWDREDIHVSQDEINDVLRQHFKPEFINRIDEVVIFHKLSREHLKKIVDIQLERVNQLLEKNGFKIKVQDSAKEFLVNAGYDPDYGARPLKRAIQRELQDPLATKVLAGDFKPGSTINIVKGPDDKFLFK